MAKIQVTIGDGAVFHGDFAVGQKIQSSFNRASEASASDQQREVMKSLAKEVATIAERLPNEKAEQIANDLQVLTNESAADSPRREWWELSAKGIKEAAKSVGEVGKTAIDLIGRLAVLMGW